MKSLFIIFIYLFCFQFHIKANFVDLKIQIDSSNFGKSNYFEFELFVIKENGSKIHLSSLEPGLKWNKVKVSGENIINFKDGRIYFNQANISRLNYKTTLNISYQQNDNFIEKKFVIELPYIETILILNERLKYNEKSLLDYKLVFNNKKVSDKNDILFLNDNIYTDFNQLIQILNGELYLHSDNVIEGNQCKIMLKNRLSNDFLAEKVVKVDFTNSCMIIAKGLSGRDGKNGHSSNVISANGEKGTNGENGNNAPDLKIFVSLLSSDSNFLIGIKSYFSNGVSQKNFLEINDSTRIVIESIGGKGGNGGNGGKGGYGTETSIYGGNGGDGGDAGNGGDSGWISIFIEQDAKFILDKLTIINKGGNSGSVGKGGVNGPGYSSSIISLIKNYNDGKNGIDGTIGSKGNGEKETLIQILTTKEFENEHSKKNKIN